MSNECKKTKCLPIINIYDRQNNLKLEHYVWLNDCQINLQISISSGPEYR